MEERNDRKPCIHFTYMHEKELDILRGKLQDVEIVGHQCDPKTGYVKEFEGDGITSTIEVLVTHMRTFTKYRHKLTGLKWVHCRSNGIDFLTKRMSTEETEPPYLFTRNQGYTNAPYAAQYIIGQIIAKERFLFEAKKAQERHEYNPSICNNHRALSELTVGILGFGKIGKEIGRICKVFGITVWGLTRKPRQVDEDICSAVDVCRTQDGLLELLENCDYVVGCLPSTEKTRGMLSGDVLSHCKQRKAVFMNIGRGDLIDNDSLMNALSQGWLSGAILDATDGEPIPASSPLWDMPGVTITPHISAYSRNSQFASDVMDIVADNYRRFVKGESLQGIADFKEGY